MSAHANGGGTLNDTLLIYNLRNVGHFTSYSQNFMAWGLSRGLRVVYCSLRSETTGLYRRFGAHPSVVFRDAAPLQDAPPPEGDRAIVEACYAWPCGGAQPRIVRRLQEEYAPRLTVLVNLDDFVFNLPFEDDLGALFATPTCGVLTFSNRDYYYCHDDLYTWRTRRLLDQDGPFCKLLDLDEYHVARRDPEQKRLAFMPDLYRVHDGAAPEAHGAELDALAAFLAAAEAAGAPVLPLLGKFDDRKNNLWILRAACESPDLRIVALGERVPSPENDAAIDALLARLDRQGRLFQAQGFVPEAAFDLVLGSPAVPCVALPYLLHAGSSGLQLFAAAHGKPCLVPDNGLMASRAVDAGIGAVFIHGDEVSFRAALAAMLSPGVAAGYAPALAAFMERFTPEAVFRALDQAFGFADGAASLPPWTVTRKPGLRLRPAQDLCAAGDFSAALAALDVVLSQTPAFASAECLKALVLVRAGRAAEAGALLSALAARGVAAADRAFHAQRLVWVLPLLKNSLAPEQMDLVLEQVLLPQCADAESLRGLGDCCVRLRRLELAREAYARAVASAPDWLELRISLSDVLRYLGRLEESLLTLEGLAALRPDAPGLACKRGQVLAEQGALEEAAKQFRLEMERGPSTYQEMAQGHLSRVLALLSGAPDR